MPKRDRERIKTRRSTLAAGANDDEESEDEEREQRRRNGAGWIGGGELGREKAVARTEGEQLVGELQIISASSIFDVLLMCSRLFYMTGARPLPPLPTALDTRRLPSSDELTDRIARISSENGLSGVGPGVGKALGAAVEVNFLRLRLSLFSSTRQLTQPIASVCHPVPHQNPRLDSSSTPSLKPNLNTDHKNLLLLCISVILIHLQSLRPA
jgi:hypothetical protein